MAIDIGALGAVPKETGELAIRFYKKVYLHVELNPYFVSVFMKIVWAVFLVHI